MGIRYRSKKEWGEPPVVSRLMEFLMQEIDYFEILIEILHAYPTPDESEVVSGKRQEELQNWLISKDDLRTKSREELQRFREAVEQLYNLEPGTYGNLKGKLLEAIVYHFGTVSFQRSDDTKIFYESQVFYDESVIGGEDDEHDFDFIFEDTQSSQADYLECKANLLNFISFSRAPEELSSPNKRKKWSYMKRLYQELTRTHSFNDFTIVIPTLNNLDELGRIRTYLDSYGYHFVTLISRDHLQKMVKRNFFTA